MEFGVDAPVRRVGNSLAIFIPARTARRARLRPGDRVHADIRTDADSPLGSLAGLNLPPFRRSEEWHDRI